MTVQEQAGAGEQARSAGWSRVDWLILLALTVLAAALRLYHLGVTPPGFQFDEAFNALDAAAVLEGQRPLFLPRNGGREVVYTYLQAALASIRGLNIVTLRLTSALAGIAAVPVSYGLLRGMLRVDSRRIAAFTSIVLAISFWHLHFSHYGIRVILMPVIFSGLFGLYWYACRTGALWPFVVSGALAGLSVWTHPTGRLTPLVLIAYTVWVAWAGRVHRADIPGARRIGPLLGLLVTGATAFLVFLPLGIEFYRHPDFFLGHAGAVSVFTDRVGGDSPLSALARHAIAVLGMFSLAGDRAWIHNLAGRPVFDVVLSIPFWIGVVLYTRRLLHRADPDRDALVMLALWAGVMLLPTVFSDDAPNFSRSLTALPALFVPAGLGLVAIVDFVGRALGGTRRGVLVGYGAALLILVFSATWAFRDYFIRFPTYREAYYAYDVDKLDAWSRLQALTGENAVYLSQLWAEHSTLEFLRRSTDVRSLDSSRTLVLPPAGKGAAYAFPAQQTRRAEQVAALWPSARLEQVPDRYGQPLLALATVDAEAAAGWPESMAPQTLVQAVFDDAPTLLGMRRDGSDLLVAWRAESLMARNLTAFLHLIDPDGRKVGQVDQLPGDGSYMTPAWQPGERVIERYSPEMEACRDDRPVRVMAGWYQLAAGGERRRRADGLGDMALAGETTIPLRSRPAGDVAPAQPGEQPFGPGVTLVGSDLEKEGLEAGAPLWLNLYWRCDSESGDCPKPVTGRNVKVNLQQSGNGGALTLWEGPIAPADSIWRAGEVLCRRLPLRLPLEADAGAYTLSLTTDGVSLPLAQVELSPSTRRYDVPPIDRELNATLGEAVKLVGATITEPEAPGEALRVTLIWQGLSPPAADYIAFVHLVNEAGEVVAQSDAVPAAANQNGGYPTSRWVAGEVVLDERSLALPADMAGSFRLLVGMYDPLTGARLEARDSAGQALPDASVQLGEVQLP
jgi:hypothetical protein